MTVVGPAPDVVIVGGGTAGSVLAARLSEDPSRRVVLLEAGPAPRTVDDFPADVLDGRRLLAAAPRSPWNADLPSRIAPGRDWGLARGRILGGSTATNGGYLVRPRTADAERWSAAGGKRWSWDRLLPLLVSFENDLDLGDRSEHGDHGPVPVRRASLAHPVSEAAMAASGTLGIPEEPDKNAQVPPGAGPVPLTVIGGIRINAAIAYLLPVLDRPNLEVRGGVSVDRVEFANGRAVAVHVRTATGPERIAAGEIVLSAGALSSPAILLRSGIGSARDLVPVGIPVVHDAPGVGGGISDHPQLSIDWRPARDLPAPTDSWMGALIDLPDHDLELLPAAASISGLTGGTDDNALSVLAAVHEPVRRGRLRLRSADPTEPADIDLGYLRTDRDLRALRSAARAARDLLATPAFDRLVGETVGPTDSELRDDRALDAWITSNVQTAFHSCGTAPFGPADDPDAVVDDRGRVHGVEGLRVADTSILPTAPTRGPACSAYLVGEVIAAAMRMP